MKSINKLFLFGLCMLLAMAVHSQNLTSGSIKVGASMEVINPPASIMTGSADVSRRFSGIHDSLMVRSIVVDNGVSRIALISMDLSKTPGGEKLVEEIAAATQIKPEHLYVTATHNHNTVQLPASDTSSDYYLLIRNATIKSVQDAIAKLQPARMGYNTGKAYINTNRDEKIGEGYHMGYNPEGPTDRTVAVVTFTSLSGDPIAIYANYPIHAVVMYRASTKDGLPEITGDLPGYTSRYVERHFPGVVSLWTSGAAGDQNPIFMATYNQDHPDVFDTGVGGYAILEVLSRRLGEEIVRVVETTKNTQEDVKIWAKKTTISTPGRKTKFPTDPNVPRGGYLAPSVIEMVDGDPVTTPLHLLMLNDVALAGIAAEVFTEIGIHLKESSPFDRTMVVTVMATAVGYIPTDTAYLMPSEKAISNRLKPGYVEPALIQAMVGLMNDYLKLTSGIQ